MSAFEAETELLSSPAAADLLHLALTGDPEVVLPGFSTRLDDLHYRPGSEVTAIYSVTYESPDGPAVTEHLLATTAEVSGPVATVTREDLVLRVWRHPGDPRLPGLAPACDPETVFGWLSDAEPRLRGAAAVGVELLAYRPLRRAVLRASVDDEDFYLKVMRPGYDDRLAARLDLLGAADLTAPLVLRPHDGVLVIPSVPGVSLAHQLIAWQDGSASLPTPADLIALLDRIPESALALPRRSSWSENIDFHAATARQHLPAEAARIDAVASVVTDVLAAGRHGPIVPTHGDFYEANIFVDGDTLRFIDIDSVGPGLREDDLACCLAHLAVLPALDGSLYARIPEVLAAWQAAFEQEVDPIDLRGRTAGVLVSLISGAEPDQALHRLELAEQYAASAR